MDAEQQYEERGLDEGDDPAQAFEALREEVAALRRGIELVYRQGREARAAAVGGPDYSPTLGVIAKELQGVVARLERIERAPAREILPPGARIALPGEQTADLWGEPHYLGQDARDAAVQSLAQLDGSVRELRGIIGAAQERTKWTGRAWLAAGGGVVAGALLCFFLCAMLPWVAAGWMAALPIGGGPWQVGESLMQRADPAAWDRMMRLYHACPADSMTELCVAAIAVRTAEPDQDPAPRAPVAPSRK
jgi:hypothetical protein